MQVTQWRELHSAYLRIVRRGPAFRATWWSPAVPGAIIAECFAREYPDDTTAEQVVRDIRAIVAPAMTVAS